MQLALSARTWARVVLYAGAIAAIFLAIGWYLSTHEGQLKQTILQFFLPDDWMFAGEHLLEHFLTPQSLPVLINAVVTGAVVLVSALTFPLKESLSASYERDTHITGRTPHEPPLWAQALEELKIVLFYAALTMTVLRLGQDATPVMGHIALVLSNLVLFTTVVIDFTSPVLARHGVRYADVVRVLASRPLRSLAFGALFGLPPVAVGWVVVHSQLAPDVGFFLIAGTYLVCIVVAVLAGTIVGGTLLEKALRTEPIGGGGRMVGWVLLAGLLTWNGLFFGGAAKALFEISPVLKCDWSLVPDTFDVSMGGGWLSPALQIKAEFTIHNPTRRTTKVEDARVDFTFDGKAIASTQLPNFEVKPGATARQPVAVEIKPKGGLIGVGLKAADAIAEGDGVLNTLKGALDVDKYKITLVIPTPAGEFPIPLLKAARK